MPVAPIENLARMRLEAGELSLGFGLRHTRTVDIARMMKTAGMDWLFIDFEHGPVNVETAAQISVAALDAGIAPIVRVPNGELSLASRLLDSGALGIVMPHVESADQARQMVQRLKYAPEGQRGVSGMIPQFGYATVDLADAVAELNRSMLLAVMLETPDAIARADEIAAVPGIDVLMIGTNDLAMALGMPGRFGDGAIARAYEEVARACRAHGKWLGSGGLGDPALFRRYVGMGARFILAGQDASFLMAAARQRVSDLRSIGLAAA
jgi:2-keto-3-deoxy-L-rhamnonate aldolase RhmA